MTNHSRCSFQVMSILAAGFIFLGTASATVAPTIRCVNSASPACGASYATIQAAVTAASPGDVILVGPGTYNETVEVATGSLFLFGAQAGNDARSGRRNVRNESVVNAAGSGPLNAGFIVTANNVVIDGFTIQGATGSANGSGIDLKGGVANASGAKILNDILQNNSQALSLNFEGFAPVTNVIVEHNLFRNNSVVSGDGIFTSAADNVIIDGNNFTGDPTAAVGINNSNNVTISGNQSNKDGTFVIITGTTNAQISNNRGKNFLSAADAFPGAGGAAVAIGGNNSHLNIHNNRFVRGGAFGVRVTNIFGGSANQDVKVSDNFVSGMAMAGLAVEAGMLNAGTILNNLLTRNKGDGIFIDTGNAGNLVSQNFARGNTGFDCDDASNGGGTLGTANTWLDNVGKASSPAGLCAPR
ncbi:MAG: right-handed parallel beta-helix repeat-containing protein [Candidatus Binataceae bacterium]